MTSFAPMARPSLFGSNPTSGAFPPPTQSQQQSVPANLFMGNQGFQPSFQPQMQNPFMQSYGGGFGGGMGGYGGGFGGGMQNPFMGGYGGGMQNPFMGGYGGGFGGYGGGMGGFGGFGGGMGGYNPYQMQNPFMGGMGGFGGGMGGYNPYQMQNPFMGGMGGFGGRPNRFDMVSAPEEGMLNPARNQFNRQMDDYMRAAPAYSQLQDLQKKMQSGEMSNDAYRQQAEELNAQMRARQDRFLSATAGRPGPVNLAMPFEDTFAGSGQPGRFDPGLMLRGLGGLGGGIARAFDNFSLAGGTPQRPSYEEAMARGNFDAPVTREQYYASANQPVKQERLPG